jgi:hypothetical protein
MFATRGERYRRDRLRGRVARWLIVDPAEIELDLGPLAGGDEAPAAYIAPKRAHKRA